jgi:hypothetical protein
MNSGQRERCWIAERDDEFLGCVFLVEMGYRKFARWTNSVPDVAASCPQKPTAVGASRRRCGGTISEVRAADAGLALTGPAPAE